MHVSLEEPLLTAAEAAKLLRISQKSIYRWSLIDGLPCRVLSRGARKRVVRFSRVELEQWLSTRTNRTAPLLPRGRRSHERTGRIV
jgi:predicted DNA-binding transcriptional regulator AlpA